MNDGGERQREDAKMREGASTSCSRRNRTTEEVNSSGILRDEGGGGRRREAKVGFLLHLEAGVTNEIGARGSRATLFD